MKFTYNMYEPAPARCKPGMEAIPDALRLVGEQVILRLNPEAEGYVARYNPARLGVPVRINGVMFADGSWKLITNYVSGDGVAWCPRLGIIKSAEIVTDNTVRFCS